MLHTTTADHLRAVRNHMIFVPGGTFRDGIGSSLYAEEAPVHRVTVDGFWTDRTPVTNRDFRDDLVLWGSVAIQAGQRRYISIAYVQNDPGVIPGLGDEADARLEQTQSWWRGWSAQCTYAGRHREAVLRSALTLKALCFTLSGAILAAPTTSLPEAIGGERNWDYRYCWLRDAGLKPADLTAHRLIRNIDLPTEWSARSGPSGSPEPYRQRHSEPPIRR